MGGKASKIKGAQGEYEIRDLLQAEVDTVYALYNTDENNIVAGSEAMRSEKLVAPRLKRNLEQVRWKAAGFGSGGYDLEGLPWLALEVKRQEKDNLYRMDLWWEQTKNAALGKDGEAGGYIREPVLMYRKNYCPWSVRMFGYLIVQDRPKGLRIQTPVDISIGAFLAYFRARVLEEIIKR